MEYYTKDSLRELRGSGSRTKSRSPSGSKGSKLVYVLIVLLLLGCAVFYVKTSHPVFFQNAVNSILKLAQRHYQISARACLIKLKITRHLRMCLIRKMSQTITLMRHRLITMPKTLTLLTTMASPAG